MDDNEFNLEKLKQKHSREKFWVGGVALVIVTSIVNWQIQWREIEIKQIEEENRHLSKFVSNILDRDPQTRLFIAEYFEILSHSIDARQRWASYKKIAKNRVEDEKNAERRRADLQVRLNEILDEIGNPNTPATRKKQLQADLIVAKIDIRETQKLLEALNPTLRKETETPVRSALVGVFGSDDRVLVAQAASAPWNSICSLNIRSDSGRYVATGFLVHPRLVLTAGYVLHLKDLGNVDAVEVACGRDRDVVPFGKLNQETLGFHHSTLALEVVRGGPLLRASSWRFLRHQAQMYSR